MTTDNRLLEKELSWLSFNERVLQEAMDKSVPLIERVRFLGIFSSNQDEFFKNRKRWRPWCAFTARLSN